MTDRRPTMAEALAIELRWMDHRDASSITGRLSHSGLTRIQIWDRCSRTLQDWYRADARRLLRVIEPYRRAARKATS